ncbi:MAG: hypothetical protein WC803_11775 [Sphingomonas sp.]|jgi:hypothetical protein
MMRAQSRAQAAADARVQRRIEAGRDRLAEIFPNIAVTAEPGAIVLTGRALLQRLTNDARLRWIKGLLQ